MGKAARLKMTGGSEPGEALGAGDMEDFFATMRIFFGTMAIVLVVCALTGFGAITYLRATGQICALPTAPLCR